MTNRLCHISHDYYLCKSTIHLATCLKLSLLRMVSAIHSLFTVILLSHQTTIDTNDKLYVQLLQWLAEFGASKICQAWVTAYTKIIIGTNQRPLTDCKTRFHWRTEQKPEDETDRRRTFSCSLLSWSTCCLAFFLELPCTSSSSASSPSSHSSSSSSETGRSTERHTKRGASRSEKRRSR